MKNSRLYQAIFEPMTVALAPRFADRAMMVTREGEIRIYGCRAFEHQDGSKEAVFVMYRSCDNGLSYTLEEVPADDPGARVASPWSNEYFTMISYKDAPHSVNRCRESHLSGAVEMQKEPEGTYLYISPNGPDGPWQKRKISDNSIHLQRLPLPLKKWRRWINVGQRKLEDGRWHPAVLLGDEKGEVWSETVLPAPPMFEVCYPHKDVRWMDPGVEPVVAETASGKLIMLLRTSTDVHYQCFSLDGGVTWSAMEPSIFYAVATMPGLYTLSDGRLLAIWNNTCPLPELDHTTQSGLSEGVMKGVQEDVFTNRDAIHGAISEDEGKSWIGFRELTLNPLRNNQDFRSDGGSWFLLDKSVHQNQIIELPDNKVLLHCGQHIKCSQLIIFDLDYLYADKRSEDFSRGMKNWSNHLYYHSLSGGCRGAGHCAWNRRAGAQLMPAPEGGSWEALQIARHRDERLFSDREGAVWNYPACRKGKIEADFTIAAGTQGLRISLADRWINPCDEYVKEYAAFSFVLDGEGKINNVKIADVNERFTLLLEFDLDCGALKITSAKGSCTIPYSRTLLPPFGSEVNLSYLHLQSAAAEEDTAGVYLHKVNMCKA